MQVVDKERDAEEFEINELVILKNKQALTTSRIVAQYFDKNHKRVLEDIRKLIEDEPQIGRMFYESNYADKYGRQKPMYLTNRDGFSLLAMGFTGKKALQFKLKFIEQFNAMEQILLNQRNAEWKAIRQAGKRGNRSMCDAVHDHVIPLARLKGSTTPDNVFYINYQKLVNKMAGIKPKSRDELPLGQLYEVEKMQSIVKTSVKGLAARGDDYKTIFRGTKQLLENYSRISLIPERFLLA